MLFRKQLRTSSEIAHNVLLKRCARNCSHARASWIGEAHVYKRASTEFTDWRKSAGLFNSVEHLPKRNKIFPRDLWLSSSDLKQWYLWTPLQPRLRPLSVSRIAGGPLLSTANRLALWPCMTFATPLPLNCGKRPLLQFGLHPKVFPLIRLPVTNAGGSGSSG